MLSNFDAAVRDPAKAAPSIQPTTATERQRRMVVLGIHRSGRSAG